MFICWYFGLIGGLYMSMIFCQDNNPLSIDNEPEEKVILSIDTGSRTSINEINSQELFACHECINCHLKTNSTIRTCQSDINMCYTIQKRINNINQIIRQGCSSLRGQCTVPNDDLSNVFDSITCCTTHKCNHGIRFQPFFVPFLFILMIYI